MLQHTKSFQFPEERKHPKFCRLVSKNNKDIFLCHRLIIIIQPRWNSTVENMGWIILNEWSVGHILWCSCSGFLVLCNILEDRTPPCSKAGQLLVSSHDTCSLACTAATPPQIVQGNLSVPCYPTRLRLHSLSLGWGYQCWHCKDPHSNFSHSKD